MFTTAHKTPEVTLLEEGPPWAERGTASSQRSLCLCHAIKVQLAPRWVPPSYPNHPGSFIFPCNTGKIHSLTKADTIVPNSPYLQHWDITGIDKTVLRWMPLNQSFIQPTLSQRSLFIQLLLTFPIGCLIHGTDTYS